MSIEKHTNNLQIKQKSKDKFAVQEWVEIEGQDWGGYDDYGEWREVFEGTLQECKDYNELRKNGQIEWE